MNINKAIRELYEEKKRLDRVIASLEEMQRTAVVPGVAPPPKRRGRKFMDPQARQEVSERMKRYWETRRKQAQALPNDLRRAPAKTFGESIKRLPVAIVEPGLNSKQTHASHCTTRKTS